MAEIQISETVRYNDKVSMSGGDDSRRPLTRLAAGPERAAGRLPHPGKR